MKLVTVDTTSLISIGRMKVPFIFEVGIIFSIKEIF